jgi:hypothetical protein
MVASVHRIPIPLPEVIKALFQDARSGVAARQRQTGKFIPSNQYNRYISKQNT